MAQTKITAPGTVVFATPANTMTVEYRDGMVRTMAGNAGGQYMLLRDDTLYFVRPVQTISISFDYIRFMAAVRASQGQMPGEKPRPGPTVAPKRSGEEETIAGLVGERARVTGPDGQSHELVITDNPVVIAGTEGLIRLSDSLVQAQPEQGQLLPPGIDLIRDRNLGVLRAGEHLWVSSVDETEPALERFQIPEPFFTEPSSIVEAMKNAG